MILAILRAQWLSMRGFRLGAGRRGALFSLLVGLVWYGFWSVAAWAALEFVSDPANRAALETALGRGLLLVFLYWQLSPLVTASLGAALDLRKLLVYPIPRGKLFVVETLLRLTANLEMLLILAGGFIGLLRNPAFGAAIAPRLLLATGGFLAFNLLLAAGLRSLIERLLARRHIREILVLLLVLVTALPRLLMMTGGRLRKILEMLSAQGHESFWPWAAAAHLMLGREILASTLMLAAWTAAAWFFGRWQFERSLRYDAQAARAGAATPRASAWIERWYRLPALLLPDPLAAIVEKELRSLSRTPRFRLVFIMGFSFGLLVWMPIALGKGGRSPLHSNFLTLVSLYALTLLAQVSYWNAFGFDRSSTQVYFSVPVPISKTLAGKNLAAGLFILLEMAAVTLACFLLRMPIAPQRILEAYLVTPIAALYMLSLGNLCSVHYPRPMDPDRVSQGGAASRMQALLIFLFPLALMPVGLAYAARYAFASQAIFYLVLGFAALVGAIMYWIAMDSSVATAERRRESLLAELSRGEGPVVRD